MKIVTLLLAMLLQVSLSLALQVTPAFAASVVANPDGTQTISGPVEQFIPNENTASVKIRGLRKVLLIPNLLQLAEGKITLIQQSLDNGTEVKLKVSSANKILDVLP